MPSRESPPTNDDSAESDEWGAPGEPDQLLYIPGTGMQATSIIHQDMYGNRFGKRSPPEPKLPAVTNTMPSAMPEVEERRLAAEVRVAEENRRATMAREAELEAREKAHYHGHPGSPQSGEFPETTTSGPRRKAQQSYNQSPNLFDDSHIDPREQAALNEAFPPLRKSITRHNEQHVSTRRPPTQHSEWGSTGEPDQHFRVPETGIAAIAVGRRPIGLNTGTTKSGLKTFVRPQGSDRNWESDNHSPLPYSREAFEDAEKRKREGMQPLARKAPAPKHKPTPQPMEDQSSLRRGPPTRAPPSDFNAQQDSCAHRNPSNLHSSGGYSNAPLAKHSNHDVFHCHHSGDGPRNGGASESNGSATSTQLENSTKSQPGPRTKSAQPTSTVRSTREAAFRRYHDGGDDWISGGVPATKIASSGSPQAIPLSEAASDETPLRSQPAPQLQRDPSKSSDNCYQYPSYGVGSTFVLNPRIPSHLRGRPRVDTGPRAPPIKGPPTDWTGSEYPYDDPRYSGPPIDADGNLLSERHRKPKWNGTRWYIPEVDEGLADEMENLGMDGGHNCGPRQYNEDLAYPPDKRERQYVRPRPEPASDPYSNQRRPRSRPTQPEYSQEPFNVPFNVPTQKGWSQGEQPRLPETYAHEVNSRGEWSYGKHYTDNMDDDDFHLHSPLRNVQPPRQEPPRVQQPSGWNNKPSAGYPHQRPSSRIKPRDKSQERSEKFQPLPHENRQDLPTEYTQARPGGQQNQSPPPGHQGPPSNGYISQQAQPSTCETNGPVDPGTPKDQPKAWSGGRGDPAYRIQPTGYSTANSKTQQPCHIPAPPRQAQPQDPRQAEAYQRERQAAMQARKRDVAENPGRMEMRENDQHVPQQPHVYTISNQKQRNDTKSVLDIEDWETVQARKPRRY